MSDEKSTYWIPIRHKRLSDGDVEVCLPQDSGQVTVNRSEVQSIRIHLKNSETNVGCIFIFLAVCKSTFFRSFFAFRLEMHDRCDNQNKTGADRRFKCVGICVLSPAHESEMRGYLVLIVKYLFHRFCLNSATVY